MTNFSHPNPAHTAGFEDIELGDLSPRGRALTRPSITAAAPPAPEKAPETEKKSLIRRTIIDPMKVFCENHPNPSIAICILFVILCLVMSIVLLSLFMGIFSDQNPMTEEMREGIENLPGFGRAYR
ncbi:hypothetical protein VTL71DRAFT_16368 [Oculimacula yallundae]|uniref:Uncharacterized protein n=1 Tax=Oculimacula yallundae TaxID=86028 RepID=A0ABR4CE99_9HELO